MTVGDRCDATYLYTGVGGRDEGFLGFDGAESE